MAKNRKNQSAAIRFGPALKALLMCLLIGGSGVGYIWQLDQIDRLGKQIKQREVRLNQLAEENEKKRKQLGMVRSPAFLEMRIKELGLGLVPPQPGQVWRLREPQPEAPPRTGPAEYAAHQGLELAP